MGKKINELVTVPDKKEGKTKFYTLNNILSKNADYNVIYGQRSNGKTTAVEKYGLDCFIDSGYKEQLAIIRRWDTDFKGNKGKNMFNQIINLGWIEQGTNGEYNSVYYYSQQWYLCYYNEKGERTRTCPTPWAYGFALNTEEHYKSISYPNVKNILFDEFIARDRYLPNEFVIFQNMLSTIIRLRDDVKIFMCGNTINQFCPYFTEMGLRNIRQQKKGCIDVYAYGSSSLTVAVEFSGLVLSKKDSTRYFAFDNPKLKMITDGVWELDIYPHLPVRYQPENIIYKFYISFDNILLEGNVVHKNETFIYIHRKTTPIRDDNKNLVYQLEPDYRRNYRTCIMRPWSKRDQFIATLFQRQKVFYQDNEVGEIVSNFMRESFTIK